MAPRKDKERRMDQRRVKGERRSMVRWEPAKATRRNGADRRKSPANVWDGELDR